MVGHISLGVPIPVHMWFLVYNTLLILAFPAILLILVSKKRCRPGLPQRLGFLPAKFPFDGHRLSKGARPLLWVHAVSLGEVVAAVPVVRLFHQRHPDYKIVISTITETGREAVERQLQGIAVHCYAPLDYSWVVHRFIRRMRPTAFLFVETELWPNILTALAQQSIPVLLINGRLSTNSYQGYSWIRSFWKQVLGRITCFLMQSERDASRIIALGAPAHRVVTTGNIKFDQKLSEDTLQRSEAFRRDLPLQSEEQLFVAGSTHPGEEEILLEAYRELHKEFPHLVLMLAPRHIERAPELVERIRAFDMQVVRRSELGPKPSARISTPTARVIILDTRGELVLAYRYAHVAFVGGTLVAVGGHNLLEPAIWGRPVFFGSFTDHVSEMARLLLAGGGAAQVTTVGELTHEIGQCLRDSQRVQLMGVAARQVIDSNQGALIQTIDTLDQVLSQPGTEKFHETWKNSSPSQPHQPLFRYQQAVWLRPFLLLLSLPYAMVAHSKRLFYQRGWLHRKRLPNRVISIGNLTVGGTGKTPLVIKFIEILESHGKRVGVLSRGYGRQSSSVPALVSDGNRLLLTPAEAGDEPYLIAQRCPQAVVAVGPNRYQLGQWVLRQYPVDCFLLDDGFQHLALDRQENVLVVDGSDPQGLWDVLPAGRLREPVSAARDASLLVMTRVNSHRDWHVDFAPLLSWVESHCPIVVVQFHADLLIEVETGQHLPLDRLVNQRVVMFSGIGNPGSFRRVVEEQGADIVAERVFDDHHLYTAEEIKSLAALFQSTDATMMVTTEKDAVKVSAVNGTLPSCYSLRIRTEILDGQEQLGQILMAGHK